MANNHKIPAKIEVEAQDPFVRYLVHLYNSGVDYQHQVVEILGSMDEYKSKLNQYMINKKLNFLLGND